jgi:RNA polymerase sigma-70 factor, ECF subfamily
VNVEEVETGGPTDRDLLAAHVAGDAAAFGVLFARHRDRLWAVALRTTGDPEEAADALQEAMIAAFRRAGSYRGDAAVTTWLHRVVVNACLDRLRRRKVRLADPLPDDLEEQLGRGSAATAAPPADDPAEVAERGDQRRQLLAALDTLPPEQRAALVLVDMQGYSVAEVAELLEVAPGTVKSRCSRARSRLLPLLSSLRPGGNPEPPPRVPSPTPTPDPGTSSASPGSRHQHGGDQP